MEYQNLNCITIIFLLLYRNGWFFLCFTKSQCYDGSHHYSTFNDHLIGSEHLRAHLYEEILHNCVFLNPPLVLTVLSGNTQPVNTFFQTSNKDLFDILRTQNFTPPGTTARYAATVRVHWSRFKIRMNGQRYAGSRRSTACHESFIRSVLCDQNEHAENTQLCAPASRPCLTTKRIPVHSQQGMNMVVHCGLFVRKNWKKKKSLRFY